MITTFVVLAVFLSLTLGFITGKDNDDKYSLVSIIMTVLIGGFLSIVLIAIRDGNIPIETKKPITPDLKIEQKVVDGVTVSDTTYIYKSDKKHDNESR